MDSSETAAVHDPPGGGGGSWLAALVQAVLAGAGSVYLATKSIPITLAAIAAAVVIVALAIRRR